MMLYIFAYTWRRDVDSAKYLTPPPPAYITTENSASGALKGARSKNNPTSQCDVIASVRHYNKMHLNVVRVLRAHHNQLRRSSRAWPNNYCIYACAAPGCTKHTHVDAHLHTSRILSQQPCLGPNATRVRRHVLPHFINSDTPAKLAARTPTHTLTSIVYTDTTQRMCVHNCVRRTAAWRRACTAYNTAHIRYI